MVRLKKIWTVFVFFYVILSATQCHAFLGLVLGALGVLGASAAGASAMTALAAGTFLMSAGSAYEQKREQKKAKKALALYQEQEAQLQSKALEKREEFSEKHKKLAKIAQKNQAAVGVASRRRAGLEPLDDTILTPLNTDVKLNRRARY